MGPRRYRRGWAADASVAYNGTGELQWGRDVIVADGRAGRRRIALANLLQWGRDVIVADGPA